ncbi:CHASE domain-containing protein [Oscillatoria sp. CS-180]|nr:CHASE domain-containing protein [Oscillatoria sp. CS-180]
MPEPSRQRGWILGVTAGLGIGLSAMVTLFVHRWEVTQQQNRFQQQIENLAIALQRSLNRYTSVLTFLSDHYAVNQGAVARLEFERFVARSLAAYPGIQALEWAPLIEQGDRLAYEQAIQAEIDDNFQITELGTGDRLARAGERAYYLPVTYVAPWLGNEAAFGFDLNSSPARAAAIEPAWHSGNIQATGRIRLVQEQRDQYGFLVVLPLYQTPIVPTSATARRSEFTGILLGVFRVADVVEEALQDLSFEINFDLYDQNAALEEQFLGRYSAADGMVRAVPDDRAAHQLRALCARPNDCTRTLEIGQRQWLVTFSPATTYPFSFPYATWTTLLTGLLLTGSLMLFLRNLQNELDRTKTLNDLKLRVFSMASHELRTPLSTIVLSAESLQTNFDQLSETQKQTNLQRIHLTAQQMTQQISDLLTLTRAEVGGLEFSPELLEAVAFCRQVIEAIQISASQPIQLSCRQPSVKAFWDKKLMRSLLTNLLSNAAKYSPETSAIEVYLDSDGHQATLQVSDRGMGIPAADQPDIQQAFKRGSNVGDVGGTGLGLAIVDVCVQQHRGTWHIHSKEGQGTTVMVTLPLE